MSVNRKLTQEQFPDLFKYAGRVLKEDLPCSTIMGWLLDHNYNLQNFLLAYTLLKYGKADEKSFMNTVNEFKEKHQAELIKKYDEDTRYKYFSPLFGNSQNSQNHNSALYQAVLQEIGSDQNKENCEEIQIKPGI